MAGGESFDAFFEKACTFRSGRDVSDEELVELLCGDCEFYKPGQEQLECSAFKILRALIRKESLSIAEIGDALR